jgi:DNA-binding transcriptional LysR family regulator
MASITPELRLLRYFVAVAEELHFRRAAERLHITQPSLSRGIRDLERTLGTDLFTRTKRSVRLTDAGRTLLDEVPYALAEVERALEETRRVGRGEVGELRLGFLPSATIELVPALLRASRAAFPGVRLRLLELLDDPQLEALRERRLDLGLLRTRQPSDDLALEPLLRERLCAVVARDHRLAGRRRVRYADLREEGLILWPRPEAPETFDAVIEACRRAGFSPKVVQEATSAYTIIGLVAAGVGVSVLAGSYSARSGGDVVFVPIAGSETVLYLAWRPTEPSAARDNLVAVARRVAARLPAAAR